MSLTRPSGTLSFRALLAMVLLLLLGATVAVLVGLSTWFSTRNFRELTETIAEQTLARVEANVEQLLARALDQNRQFVQIVATRGFTNTDFTLAARFLMNSLEARPSLARLTLVLEPSGEFVQAERRTNGAVRIREGHSVGSNELAVVAWNWGSEPAAKPLTTNVPASWVRDDEGFRQARATGRSIWTRAYAWDDPEDQARWGIRLASPVVDAAGNVVAVCGASLTLEELNRYLRELDAEVPGFVAIIEAGSANQPLRLIGHPDGTQVGRELPANPGQDAALVQEPVLAAYFKRLREVEFAGARQLPYKDFGREFQLGSTNYLGSIRRLEGSEDPPWFLVMLMPVSEVAGGVAQNLRWATVAALGFVAIAIVTALALARKIAEPMRQLSGEARSMSQLQFEASGRPLSKIREVRQLEQALGDARSSLRSFRKYVPAEVVNALVSSGVEAKLGGVDTRMTILFSDVVDFTRLAETVSAQVLVVHLGEYLAAVSTVLQRHAGTVDKFIGDGVMAFWGAPKSNPKHALDGCVAAWRVQQELERLNALWVAEGKVAFPTRIGINTGVVIVGNIGSESRMNYTAVGDPVNVASRLESLNRTFGTRILISEETRLAAGGDLLTRPVSRVAVKGSDRGFVVYELVGLEAEADLNVHRLIDLTVPAFVAFERGDWKESFRLYGILLEEFPHDGVALAQREFITLHQNDAPRGDSEVIRRMTTK